MAYGLRWPLRLPLKACTRHTTTPLIRHERGHGWRMVWSPPPAASEKASEKQLAEWTKLTKWMIGGRERVAHAFKGGGWRQESRVADTLHAFDVAFTDCFLGALRYELIASYEL
jgi:hypothetical protein